MRIATRRSVLVSGASLVSVMILLVGVLAGGCSGIGLLSEEPNPTPLPTPQWVDYDALYSQWQGYLSIQGVAPHIRESLETNFPVPASAYRLVGAGRYDTYRFRDFLNEYGGGFGDSSSYLQDIINRMVAEDLWIGVDESPIQYMERLGNTQRAADLSGFFSSNSEVEFMLLALVRADTLHPMAKLATERAMEGRVGEMLLNDPDILLAQEFARGDFHWRGLR